MQPKIYRDDNLLMISGLNIHVARRHNIEMDVFRYDPVLVILYFSLPPNQSDEFQERWCKYTGNVVQSMIERVKELGIHDEESVFTLLRDCYRISIPRGHKYRFEIDSEEWEHVCICEDDIIYTA